MLTYSSLKLSTFSSQISFYTKTCNKIIFLYCPDNKIKFTASLKEERNCWAMLIEEMRAGKAVAEATKDFTVIGQAVQNVLLADAVIRRLVCFSS